MNLHASAAVRDRGGAGAVLDCALLRIAARGQHGGERLIDPRDDGGIRAEIRFQPQRLQPQVAQADSSYG